MEKNEIKKVCITSGEAARYMGVHPQSLRILFKNKEARANLGFPVIEVGSRFYIPKEPFYQYLGVKETEKY